MSSKRPEVPESERQLDELKFEVAEELQLDDDILEKGFANTNIQFKERDLVQTIVPFLCFRLGTQGLAGTDYIKCS